MDQRTQIADLEAGTDLVLILLDKVEDEDQYAAEMTRLIRALWTVLRNDPFPSPRGVAEALSGLKSTDGAGLIERILAFPKTDGTDGTSEVLSFPSPATGRVN